ncbi:MAG: hypothetical protein SFV54_05065 [Bryobacteraceae bacterium]|nr:hypothetical protein [Bryobacteraceae bacterium]
MKGLQRIGWFAVGLAAAYLFVVFLHRDLSERRMRIRSRQPVAAVIDEGEPGLRILAFYANSGELIRGEHAVVCYGVRDAAAVRLEPPVETLKPVWSRCFSVYPRENTTYTTAVDGSGKSTSASFAIDVVPPPPRILFISISSDDVKLGEPVTLCYGVKNAVAAWLEPLRQPLRISEKTCIRSIPVRTLDYTFVAKGETGALDREKFTIKVRQRR